MRIRTYAGIGSSKTPAPIGRRMHRIATRLEALGWLLQSGGNGHPKPGKEPTGADAWFESGVHDSGNARIFLPWEGAFGHPSPLHVVDERAHVIARYYHPAYHRLSPSGRLLMGRNSYQVLGADLDEPVAFVVCWTPGGRVTGGTGQALRIAADHGIPIFNLHDETALVRLGAFIQASEAGDL